MPELPEVETTCRGIAPHVCGRKITRVVVRDARLRRPVPARLAGAVRGQVIETVTRRGKYLLLTTGKGTLIIHLGMSGSLRVVDAASAPARHDHVDIILAGGRCLRLRDPRRFGLLLWCRGDPLQHELLRDLGPEPLSADFDGDYLFARSRGRQVAVKQFLMNGHTVVGIGNIYASEALFRAGIHPARAAGRISLVRYRRLAQAASRVLRQAIRQGGTTLRDFTGGDGRPGYFRQRLDVYGRDGQPCRRCGTAIRLLRQGQRASYYCPHCQR